MSRRGIGRALLRVWAAPLVLKALVLTGPAMGQTGWDERLKQAQDLVQHGDLVAAKKELSAALQTNPRHPGLRNLMGVVEAQQGDYRSAEADFRLAIEIDPHFTGAYLNLGHLYQEAGGRDPDAAKKALSTYQQLLKFEGGNVEALYQSALLLERSGSFKASLAALSSLPSAVQERAMSLAIACADYAGLGDVPQANSRADRLVSSAELAEADVLPILPVLAAHARDDLAARLLQALAQRQLASPLALRQLGLVYEGRGQLDQARATLEKVAEAQPSSLPVLLDLARVAYAQKDFRSALGYLAHARDLDPQNPGVHFFFGIACLEENLLQEAYNSLGKAVSLEPENPYYNYALGVAAVEYNDPGEAVLRFEKYRSLKPQDPRGQFALGAACFYNRDYDKAREYLVRSAEHPETAAGAHYLLGRIANKQGDLPLAAEELDRALEALPDYADALAELGAVRLKQKEPAAAEAAFRRALAIDADN